MMRLTRRNTIKAMAVGVATPVIMPEPTVPPTRPTRSKPYIEEGRPEYEEPSGYLCVQHGGSPGYERVNATNGLECPQCAEPEWVAMQGFTEVVYPISPSQIEVLRCGSGVVVLDGYNLGDNGDRWAHWRYVELEGDMA
jgi:hypothetical protein